MGLSLGKIFKKVTGAAKKFVESDLGGVLLGSGISFGADALARQETSAQSFENFEKQWNFKSSKGLTPNEIVGTPTNNAPPSANTLGSNQTFQQQRLQKNQLKFQANQAQLDRDNKLQVAQLQQQAPSRQAGVAEGNLSLAQQIQPLKMKQMEAQFSKLWAETELIQKNYKEFWPKIFAQMGPENIMGALASFNSGISLEQILQGSGNPTPEERAAIEKLYTRYLLARDIVGKKVLTAKELKTQVVDYIPELIKDVKAIGTNFLGKSTQKTNSINQKIKENKLERTFGR